MHGGINLDNRTMPLRFAGHPQSDCDRIARAMRRIRGLGILDKSGSMCHKVTPEDFATISTAVRDNFFGALTRWATLKPRVTSPHQSPRSLETTGEVHEQMEHGTDV